MKLAADTQEKGVAPALRPLLMVGIVVSPLIFGWPVLRRPYSRWLKAGVVLAMLMEIALLAFGAPGEMPAIISSFKLLQSALH